MTTPLLKNDKSYKEPLEINVKIKMDEIGKLVNKLKFKNKEEALNFINSSLNEKLDNFNYIINNEKYFLHFLNTKDPILFKLYISTKFLAFLLMEFGFNNEEFSYKSINKQKIKINEILKFVNTWNMDHVKEDNSEIFKKVCVVIPTKLDNSRKQCIGYLKMSISYLSNLENIHKILLIGYIEPHIYKEFENFKKLVIIPDENSIPSISRNIGIDYSLDLNSDVTLFMDDDIILKDKDKILIEQMLDMCVSTKGCCMPLIKGKTNDWLSIFHDLDGTLNGRYLNKNILLFGTTCFFMVNNEIFESGVKFDEKFKLAAGEDIEFCLNILSKKYPILAYDKNFVVHDYGYGNVGLNKFVERYIRYGKGNRHLITKHNDYWKLLNYTTPRRTLYQDLGKNIKYLKSDPIYYYLIKILDNIKIE